MAATKEERENILKSTAFDLITVIMRDKDLDEAAKQKVAELIKAYVRECTQ